MKQHNIVCETRTPTEVLFVCETCSRKVVINFADRRMTVIERGDRDAVHSTGGMTIAVK